MFCLWDSRSTIETMAGLTKYPPFHLYWSTGSPLFSISYRDSLLNQTGTMAGLVPPFHPKLVAPDLMLTIDLFTRLSMLIFGVGPCLTAMFRLSFPLLLLLLFKFSDCSVFKIQTVVRVHTIVAEVSASFKRTPPGYGYDWLRSLYSKIHPYPFFLIRSSLTASFDGNLGSEHSKFGIAPLKCSPVCVTSVQLHLVRLNWIKVSSSEGFHDNSSLFPSK